MHYYVITDDDLMQSKMQERGLFAKGVRKGQIIHLKDGDEVGDFLLSGKIDFAAGDTATFLMDYSMKREGGIFAIKKIEESAFSDQIYVIMTSSSDRTTELYEAELDHISQLRNELICPSGKVGGKSSMWSLFCLRRRSSNKRKRRVEKNR